MYNVPQFVDVEDKIAGPLTWKQLLWMIALGVIMLVLWNTLELVPFVIVSVPFILLFAALAFYKPQGQPLIKMIFYGMLFVVNPKTYVWRQYSTQPQRSVTSKNAKVAKDHGVEIMSLEEINALSQTLDDPDAALAKKTKDATLKH